jgi:hypothetical protein
VISETDLEKALHLRLDDGSECVALLSNLDLASERATARLWILDGGRQRSETRSLEWGQITEATPFVGDLDQMYALNARALNQTASPVEHATEPQSPQILSGGRYEFHLSDGSVVVGTVEASHERQAGLLHVVVLDDGNRRPLSETIIERSEAL